MPSTSDEFRFAQTWIGSRETKETFDERVDRLLPDLEDQAVAVDTAIEESLREQLSKMTLDTPSAMSVEGVSISYVTNITTLRAALKAFMTSAKGSSGAMVQKMFRQPTR